eukprot:366111-Chlamydomonas_euryale.AAC.20
MLKIHTLNSGTAHALHPLPSPPCAAAHSFPQVKTACACTVCSAARSAPCSTPCIAPCATPCAASQVNRVSEVVTSMADPNCNIIFGAVVDELYDGELHVTIIATGFSQSYEEQVWGVGMYCTCGGMPRRPRQDRTCLGAS